MNTTFGIILLFSVLVTGLIVNPANTTFAQTTGNSTNTNSTATTLDESMKTGDDMVTPDHDMMEQDNSTKTIDESMKTDDDMMEPEDIPAILSPLKQIKNGVVSQDVVCKEGLELAFKFNGQAACVKSSSIEKLITRGWTQ